MLDAQGEVMPGCGREDCDPLTGDSVNQAVTWGRVRALPAGPLRLRFILRNASLYAFAVGDSRCAGVKE